MRALTPLRLPNGVTVANRLAVAPMTTTQSAEDGRPSPEERAWLGRLADDGYGLVLTCAAAVSRASIAFPRQLSFGDDALLPDLRSLAADLRARGAVAIVQLCHGGSRALPHLTGVPNASASAYDLPGVPGWVPPRALTEPEIEQIIADHAAAARRAAAAGFAGVELHGANGYLFTQLLSRMSNHRTDRWGGSLTNRARLSREVVRAIRSVVLPDFIVGFRMTFEGGGFDTGLDLDEGVEVMNWLAEDGIDYGHVSHLDLTARSQRHPGEVALSRIRRGVDAALPLMAAGGVFAAEDAERALDLGADLVAIGRAAIGNDQIPARFARGEALRRPPYARGDVEALGVSPAFQGYLTGPGPVASMRLLKEG